MFEIQGKVALVTGGASGIGLAIAYELLKNGLKGVGIVDINEKLGTDEVKKINAVFGENKAIFIKTDVAERNQIDDAFKIVTGTFKNLDIVINSAGMMKNSQWEREIAVNLTRTVATNVLAFEEYLPKYKTEEECVIINVSSVVGIRVFAYTPVYSATKYGVIGLTRSFGSKFHYERSKIKVMAVCPGYTETAFQCLPDKLLGSVYYDIREKEFNRLVPQSPEYVAKAMITMMRQGESGSIWIVEDNKPAYTVNIE
ncbi:hypothetical protein FQA39_LY03941 [Lamprigera yunnana]|nr:hypothetical protein FQA39_LY03941 [Lamprigera yunnana]